MIQEAGYRKLEADLLAHDYIRWLAVWVVRRSQSASSPARQRKLVRCSMARDAGPGPQGLAAAPVCGVCGWGRASCSLFFCLTDVQVSWASCAHKLTHTHTHTAGSSGASSRAPCGVAHGLTCSAAARPWLLKQLATPAHNKLESRRSPLGTTAPEPPASRKLTPPA